MPILDKPNQIILKTSGLLLFVLTVFVAGTLFGARYFGMSPPHNFKFYNDGEIEMIISQGLATKLPMTDHYHIVHYKLLKPN